jgi:hypothetical protein
MRNGRNKFTDCLKYVLDFFLKITVPIFTHFQMQLLSYICHFVSGRDDILMQFYLSAVKSSELTAFDH